MSAAATAAGYLYASGRLRGRNAQEADHKETAKPQRKMRVAVMPQEPEQPPVAPKARPAPKIQYRTRRWKPE
jgi:hypothetical protein